MIEPNVELTSCTKQVNVRPEEPVLAASSSTKIEFTPLEPLFAL